MKIIVPTDFSTVSYNALRIAKDFAKASGGSIVLLHVIEPPSASFLSLTQNMDSVLEDAFIAELIERIDRQLDALKVANDDVLIKIVRKVGDPYREIRDLALWEKAELIVMGEKGQGADKNLFLGSLTDKIVRTSKAPVITVNQTIEDHPIQNIVYATDLQDEHPRLIRLLKEMQSIFGAKLQIVRINTRDKYANDLETMVALRRLVDQFEIKNYSIDTYNHEDEEDGVIYYADQVAADLICIGVHRKTGIRRLINGGSLAEVVADHVNRPVLTFHFDRK